MKIHTDEQCLIKLKAINTLLQQIKRGTKSTDINTFALAESIEQLCVELIREFPDDISQDEGC